MRPPENITVSEWAEKYRRLSQSSAEPGMWRTHRTPYLKEPMDAFNDPKVRRIVMVAASQVGKSELELNCIGYVIHQDPGHILYIHPDIEDAKKFSQVRVTPLINETPVLKSRVAKSKSRDSSNTMLKKTFPGGMLIICGSNVAADLASIPARYIFGDERDRWAASAGQEGDPWELARARQITFYNSKAVEVSTPTIKNASAIAASFSEGTMERWCTKCPHCGEYHNITFADIRYEYDETIVSGKKTFHVNDAYYICPDCGSISTEAVMKKQPAKWIAENPDAYSQGVRSFWLNAFVSPWGSWKDIILQYLKSIGNSKKLQVVYNTRFGELWEDRGDLEDEDSLLARREDYGQRPDGSPVELPEGVLVLTCGVDTQDDRLEYEVVGHGHFGETWGIKKGIIMGRPDDSSTWATLDDVLDHVYRFECGAGLRISMTFVDEGGHFTQDVRLQCRARLAKKVFAIKGSQGDGVPFTSPPKKQKIVDEKKRQVGTCWQYMLGVDAGKQIIMDNLRVKTPGSKYCHFPRREDYGSAYFTSLLSERLVYKPERRKPWQWEVIPGHERNEALDCRNYALAAFKALPVDLDAVDKRLKVIKQEMLRLPSVSPASAATSTAQPKAARKKTKGGSSRNKYCDDW